MLEHYHNINSVADCDMDWALFRNLAPDPCPKVQSLMKVA